MTAQGAADEPAGLAVDYVELYVEDLDARAADLAHAYAFVPVGRTGSPGLGYRSEVLKHGDITLVLTEGLEPRHPAAHYVATHGDGVADIALRTREVRRTFAEAVARGARAVREPTAHEGPGPEATAAVAGFGDCVHTLVQRRADDTACLPAGFPGLEPAPARRHPSGSAPDDAHLMTIDHFAFCVEPGKLAATTAFYREAFGLREIFEERIVLGAQAMNSKVVQNDAATVTFTVIEPADGTEPGQIDEFVAHHRGAGVQHIAFATDDIVESVRWLSSRGVEFLTTPGAYYERLVERVEVRRHPLPDLEKLGILVDQDHDGQLFQIFTRSTHPRRTLFFELIERIGARTFGTSNIKSLYEAVASEQARRAG